MSGTANRTSTVAGSRTVVRDDWWDDLASRETPSRAGEEFESAFPFPKLAHAQAHIPPAAADFPERHGWRSAAASWNRFEPYEDGHQPRHSGWTQTRAAIGPDESPRGVDSAGAPTIRALVDLQLRPYEERATPDSDGHVV